MISKILTLVAVLVSSICFADEAYVPLNNEVMDKIEANKNTCVAGDTDVGPLTQMEEFLVIFFADSDEEQLFNSVVDSLKQCGNVQFADDSEHPFTTTRPSPALLISMGEWERASVRVFAEVAVQPSQYKTAAQIWASQFIPDNLPLPVILEDGSVAFRRENEEAGTGNTDIPTVASQLVAKFAAQYRSDNPGNDRPSFYVYRSFI